MDPIALLREIQCTLPYSVPVDRPVDRLQELLALTGSARAMGSIGAGLTIGGLGMASKANDADLAERRWLAQDGIAGLRGAVERDVRDALVSATDALAARGLPACFVYAFDEAWAIGEALRARIATLTGREYRLIEDVWAWRVAPGTRGWPPHRGISHACLDRQAPEVLNVWVALSDVTADRSCMHAVPLNDDPDYPSALSRTEAAPASIRALPLAAGDALFWNANVLHWGGRCAERAAGPRVSCSFTLARSDAEGRLVGDLIPLRAAAALDLSARMDMIARMIAVYGDLAQPSEVVREWATLTHALASRFGRSAP